MHLQQTKYHGMASTNHWKIVLHDGYDIVHGRQVDYGNKEYYVLLRCVCHLSPYCYACVKWLGRYHFGSLHPDAALTDHACEMQGDVFEIAMAALRGHPEFAEVLPEGLPQIFVKLIFVCRTVQMLDACIRTGYVKWQGAKAPKLARLRPELADHPFVREWSQGLAAQASALRMLG